MIIALTTQVCHFQCLIGRKLRTSAQACWWAQCLPNHALLDKQLQVHSAPGWHTFIRL